MGKTDKVVVGLSGGVDSAVAAMRLLEAGHHVEGLFMKNWEDDDTLTHCAAEEDLAEAQAVADHLGIRLHRANFAARYREQVFEVCLREYRAGRTPNPDILCNQRIKFRAFLDHALSLGASKVATGHYAGVGEQGGRFTLLRGEDPHKDQSYFLYTLGQAQLRHSLFPLSELPKPEVRRQAAAAGLPNHARRDSTGICFIGERDFRAFLSRYIQRSPGPMETPEGQVVGEHQGLAFYTLGQRRGLGLGGLPDHDEGAWYVADKDMARNALIVVQGHAHPRLLSTALVADELSWVAGAPPTLPLRCTVKSRYRQQDQPCALEAGPSPTSVVVRFDTPQRAVTPGQSVVFYQGRVCLGGGIIQTRTPVE
ncbi:tRNA 2-thiouridine(34) synthase MnmA [Alkalilimnicola ehrlichii MLHE-1]|uniref:tRNA-specific 2-thiouridylase MnmA n=1 Tax=Alkalilimnicola ehrlichii (strain ATCC BAA-1101 / DSM 17681 / MLHE-1) TaxID=187272 RepID=MNMA_ALKEH|nr:tRNA 2-thiouridine(34) synthase MnmA [Alkalilimnicola ehrlichii]Q0A8N7.1 RecName: Full=tRNA-specific 2-thiouridylase MnmA [Alkalilimnicola ehrlichii MLHE-1]ABI56800.1 tRNA (5-methylaminomethyl-2-thiouridylate)-methyltransferase [Alkalilimnicola ehrlichii MLHE-1]